MAKEVSVEMGPQGQNERHGQLALQQGCYLVRKLLLCRLGAEGEELLELIGKECQAIDVWMGFQTTRRVTVSSTGAPLKPGVISLERSCRTGKPFSMVRPTTLHLPAIPSTGVASRKLKLVRVWPSTLAEQPKCRAVTHSGSRSFKRRRAVSSASGPRHQAGST
jgi:hypothetical protein